MRSNNKKETSTEKEIKILRKRFAQGRATKKQ